MKLNCSFTRIWILALIMACMVATATGRPHKIVFNSLRDPNPGSILGLFEGMQHHVSCQDGSPIKGLTTWWGELEENMENEEQAVVGLSLNCGGKPLRVEGVEGVREVPDSYIFGHASNKTRSAKCETEGISSLKWRHVKWMPPDPEDDDSEDHMQNPFVGAIILMCKAAKEGEAQSGLIMDLEDHTNEPAAIDKVFVHEAVCPDDGNVITTLDMWSSLARWSGSEVIQCKRVSSATSDATNS